MTYAAGFSMGLQVGVGLGVLATYIAHGIVLALAWAALRWATKRGYVTVGER